MELSGIYMTGALGHTLCVTKADRAQGGQGHSAVDLGAGVSGILVPCGHSLARGTWAQQLQEGL